MERVERLQYITQGTTPHSIEHEVRSVLEGGCRWVQLRMKDAQQDTIIEIGRRIKSICHSYGAKLIINDSVEICKSVDADGVHLGKCDMQTEKARALLGPEKIIGRTCNTAEDVLSTIDTAIDYIGLGPLKFTTTKKHLSPIIGLEGYGKIISDTKATIPIVAVGGITLEDISPLLGQGVYGVALSGTIAKSENISNTTRNILNIINR
ncbi:MAG: thiamine phosphate synthase [Rikenellaceae bacterium]